jgi:hypothetical protein
MGVIERLESIRVPGGSTTEREPVQDEYRDRHCGRQNTTGEGIGKKNPEDRIQDREDKVFSYVVKDYVTNDCSSDCESQIHRFI